MLNTETDNCLYFHIDYQLLTHYSAQCSVAQKQHAEKCMAHAVLEEQQKNSASCLTVRAFQLF